MLPVGFEMKRRLYMTIQEVAEQTGISAFTIRYYEKAGVLPPIKRMPNGIRQFSEADVTFLLFLLQLKQTGMSLEDIMEFTEDGCMLERVQQGEDIPQLVVEKRLAILRRHQRQLYEQRRNLDSLLMAVEQKLNFYEQYQNDTPIYAQKSPSGRDAC
jgi:MerR family transcriptional regulator, aldehyde-responsive regulator